MSAEISKNSPSYRKKLLYRLRSFRVRKNEKRDLLRASSCTELYRYSKEEDTDVETGEQCTSHKWTIDVVRNNIKKQLLQPLQHLQYVENLILNVGEVEKLPEYFNTCSPLELNQMFLWAAFIGRLDYLTILNELGVDILHVDETGNFSALHLSSFAGSVECCQWLLQKGVFYSGGYPKVNNGLSPLHYAILANSREVMDLLVKYGFTVNHSLLSSAVYSNSVDCLKFILSLGVDVNAYHDGMNALHNAVDLNHLECVRYLLENPLIQVNLKSANTGFTALHIAAENGYVECMQLLIKKGAKVTETNNKQQTPLHIACKMQHVESVKCLLSNFAAANTTDLDKKTPLHNAITKCSSSIVIVRLLVKQEADINVADRYGYTPLHIAAVNEMEECVEFLILQGANVAAKTKGGITALNVIKRKTPTCGGAIRKRLTKSLSHTFEEDLKFDFRDLLRNSSVGETDYLYTLHKEGEKEILHHPLCRAFLYLKWQKVKPYYIIRICLSLIAVILINIYVFLTIVREDCHYFERKLNLQGPAVNACNRFYYLNNLPVSVYPNYWILRTCNFGFAGYYMTRLFFSLPSYRCIRQFFNLLDILELTITLGMTAFLLQLGGKGVKHSDGYYLRRFIGIIVVFLSWIHLLIMTGQQFFRTYVVMFKKVSYECSKLLLVYFCLLFGFTCTFCILLQDMIYDFRNPVVGFVKVFAMMTGEINFSEIINNIESPHNKYMAFLFLAIFIVLITFVLMNLMVGIAVNDVEGLRKTAVLIKLVQRVQAIYFLELSCFDGLFPDKVAKVIRNLLYVWPNSYQKVIYVRPSNPNENVLPKDIVNEGLELVLRKETEVNNSGGCEFKEEMLLEKYLLEFNTMLSRLNTIAQKFENISKN